MKSINSVTSVLQVPTAIEPNVPDEIVFPLIVNGVTVVVEVGFIVPFSTVTPNTPFTQTASDCAKALIAFFHVPFNST